MRFRVHARVSRNFTVLIETEAKSLVKSCQGLPARFRGNLSQSWISAIEIHLSHER